MKRCDVVKKKVKLFNEINEMIKCRTDADCYKLNLLIEKKKKEYKFYCNLLKNM